MSLTLCMIVKNEEALLGPLLKRMKPICQDMIITDTGSTDGTLEVIRKAGARLVQWPLEMDYARTRNAGLDLVETPWVLALDADEWPSDFLLTWLDGFEKTNAVSIYRAITLLRENRIEGQLLPEPRDHERHIRIFRRYLRYVGRLHEHIVCQPEKVVNAPAAALLLHHKTQARQEMQNKFYGQWPEQQEAIKNAAQ